MGQPRLRQAGLVHDHPGGLRSAGRRTCRQAATTSTTSTSSTPSTGSVLYRHDTVNFDKGDALVYENYPGAPRGGKQHVVNLIKKGFVAKSAKYLSGPHVIAWADINDDNVRNADERVAVPGTPARRAVPLQARFPGRVATVLADAYLCTWDPATADSWRTNLKADVTQGFYFDNIYARYLEHAPFGFTAAAGNFKGDDPVLLNSLDGANTDGGLPRRQPRQQREHEHAAGRHPADHADVPVRPARCLDCPASSDFDPGIIFHEYTHGLCNRLVVDAAGNSTLNSVQVALDGRGLERLLRDGLPGHQGLREGHREARPDPDGGVRQHRHRLQGAAHDAARLPGRHHVAATAATCSAASAATPTATSPASSASPKCTPPVRSGRRRSGTCGTRSATGSPPTW